MDGNHIRILQQTIEIDPLVVRIVVCTGGGVIDHTAAECLCNRSHFSADRAKADDAPRLALQLGERSVHAGEKTAGGVAAVFYVIIVITEFFCQIEVHRKGVLGHADGGIAGDVRHGDVVALHIIEIDVVDAGCGDADQFQVLRAGQGAAAHAHLVADDNIRLPHTLRAFLLRCFFIYCHFSKTGKAGQIHVLSQ